MYPSLETIRIPWKLFKSISLKFMEICLIWSSSTEIKLSELILFVNVPKGYKISFVLMLSSVLKSGNSEEDDVSFAKISLYSSKGLLMKFSSSSDSRYVNLFSGKRMSSPHRVINGCSIIGSGALKRSSLNPKS